MAKGTKRLEKMRANPSGWTKEDVAALCENMDIRCKQPHGTSHFAVTDPTLRHILTVVAAKPIKPIYIKKLVAFVDAVHHARAVKEGQHDTGL